MRSPVAITWSMPRLEQRGAEADGVGVGLGAASEVQVGDVRESRGLFHATRLGVDREPAASNSCRRRNIAGTSSASDRYQRYLIGKYPTLVTIACPSGDSTQSVNALMSADGLARV